MSNIYFKKRIKQPSNPEQPIFIFDNTLDISLSSLLHQILPLCTNFYIISEFVDSRFDFQYGLTNHAFCAAINQLLQDYHSLVTTFEYQQRTGQLTLQKLWYLLQPSIKTFATLSRLIIESKKMKARGGQLINLIHQQNNLFGGDTKTMELFEYLLEKAAQPYLEMVGNWVYKGSINDPHSEFLVVENKRVHKENLKRDFNDAYWERRYTLRKDEIKPSRNYKSRRSHEERERLRSSPDSFLSSVPFFLALSTEKLLMTGKYLNVIKECGIEINYPYEEKFYYTPNEQEYIEMIDKAHSYASTLLLDIMIKENKLFDHLNALKRYFLLGTGDFMSLFIDTAKEELDKNVIEVVPSKLVSFLGIALSSSVSSRDLMKDNLSCQLLPNNLISQLLTILNIKHLEKEKADKIKAKFTGKNMFVYQAKNPIKSEEKELFEKIIENENQNQNLNQNENDENESDENIPMLDAIINQQQPNVTGFDAFSLDYEVKWPVSLVINRKALTKYQIIFRHLFNCKKIEKQICDTWAAQQSTKEIDLELALLGAYTLRQKMLYFLQHLQYYMHFEVIEQNWKKFIARLADVSSVDELMLYHNDFLDSCLKECLLTNPRLLRIMSKLLMTCEIFSTHTTRLTESLTVTKHDELPLESRLPSFSSQYNDSLSDLLTPKENQEHLKSIEDHKTRFSKRAQRIDVQTAHVHKMFQEKGYLGMVRNSEEKFIFHLGMLIKSLQAYTHTDADPHMIDLITRLDYNNFYSKFFDSEEFKELRRKNQSSLLFKQK
ncbi:gamma-tubulin complex component 2 [Anaeramoeba ignava]|uniref:Gamma-tubulin complex component 2 n=1 Tax=Anaeramoeba ignava TaxID=1746090 RepID=A0A9Q0RFT9_ANAIG|nr:gamma-tubulin complex component 2 [Anaeramoeba ignava]